MNTAQKIAALELRIGGHAIEADQAVVRGAWDRLIAALMAVLPPVPDDGATQPRKWPTAPRQFEMQLSSLDRIEALGARLSAGTATKADNAILAGLDPADLAIVECTAQSYVQHVANFIARDGERKF